MLCREDALYICLLYSALSSPDHGRDIRRARLIKPSQKKFVFFLKHSAIKTQPVLLSFPRLFLKLVYFHIFTLQYSPLCVSYTPLTTNVHSGVDSNRAGFTLIEDIWSPTLVELL